MGIMDGINLGIGFILAPFVLSGIIALGLLVLGLIAYPFIYGYRKLKTKKEVKTNE